MYEANQASEDFDLANNDECYKIVSTNRQTVLDFAAETIKYEIA